MKVDPVAKFFGLSRTGSCLLLSGAGLLVCILVLYPVYVLFPLRQAFLPARTATATFPPLFIGTPTAYVPAPSLTPLPPDTATLLPPTRTPTKTPTNTPTRTPTRTPTNTPTRTPTRTPTSPPTNTSTPTSTPNPMGAFLNPIPMGTGRTFPGLGTLTVLQSNWSPGKTGLAVLDLAFRCERPSGQQCNLDNFIIHAVGSSGHSYIRYFDPSIPEPPFGMNEDAVLDGGASEWGYWGFLISESETSLKLSVQVFLEEGQTFFWMWGTPPTG